MKRLILTFIVALTVMAVEAKTLIVYYSFTNNVHTIVTDLQAQTGADAVRIEPAEERLDYAADGYAIGSALISAIREHPADVSSYPEIKSVEVNLDEYSTVIIAAPLWWSNMAAPLQTFLFHHGAQMAGKKIGLVVSSASSGISGVEADARRLVPEGDFLMPSLWIRSSQTSSCHAMISDWLTQIDYSSLANGIEQTVSDIAADMRVNSDMIIVDGKFESLALYNTSGNKVMESSGHVIATSSLPSGIYVARINAGNLSSSKKITIKR